MQAFDQSYRQSPHASMLQQVNSVTMPRDIHIDLGNYCNLACKMCSPDASSKIASHYRDWQILDRNHVGLDWTKDEATWHRVVTEILEIPDLANIHFMGGETVLTPRFEDFLDACILANRTDFALSFVTNGTQINAKLLAKLQKFQKVNIEISIESLDHNVNTYQRQGTNTDCVLRNLQIVRDWADANHATITIRSALSLLTVGTYHTLLEFCWNHDLVIKRLTVTHPAYLDLTILPESVRQIYKVKYLEEAARLGSGKLPADINRSNPQHAKLIVASEIDACITLLSSDRPADADKRLAEMVGWCKKWDQIYGYDALTTYPELSHIFKAHGY